MTDKTDVEALVAKQAIAEVLHRYCRGIDRMDAPMTLSCWHADGTADYGGLYRGSAAGFVEWLWPVHAAMVGHHHNLSNITIVVDAGASTAGSESYVYVTLRCREADGQLVDIVGQGRYLDRWECRDGTWAIVHRTYVGDLSETRLVEQRDVSALLPPASKAGPRHTARRDEGDPSYAVLDGRLLEST